MRRCVDQSAYDIIVLRSMKSSNLTEDYPAEGSKDSFVACRVLNENLCKLLNYFPYFQTYCFLDLGEQFTFVGFVKNWITSVTSGDRRNAFESRARALSHSWNWPCDVTALRLTEISPCDLWTSAKLGIKSTDLSSIEYELRISFVSQFLHLSPL